MDWVSACGEAARTGSERSGWDHSIG